MKVAQKMRVTQLQVDQLNIVDLQKRATKVMDMVPNPVASALAVTWLVGQNFAEIVYSAFHSDIVGLRCRQAALVAQHSPAVLDGAAPAAQHLPTALDGTYNLAYLAGSKLYAHSASEMFLVAQEL